MPRKLSDKFKWEPELAKLEHLEWNRDPADFDKLCEVVLAKLNDRLKDRTADEIIPMPELRSEIRRAAENFNEKYISLPFFVFMWMKEVIAAELRRRKGKAS